MRITGRLLYLYLFNPARPLRRDFAVTPAAPVTLTDLTVFDPQIDSFWNRRHYIALSSSIRFASGLTLTGVGHVHSGAPYRRLPAEPLGLPVPHTQPETLSYGPYRRQIDARIDLPIRPTEGRLGFIVFAEGRNLTNEHNVETVADPDALRRSGAPDHPAIPQTQRVYGPARSVWTGVEVRW
ncbi:MAG: hypothetical protein FJY97_00365 [candidate division Zixibacteria bacterium]|nr:hypothetical protein [candidate division Zixibacteria bacterium]